MLEERYETYCNNGVSRFAALFACLLDILAWTFLKLESPEWQRVRANHQCWFPHINPVRPRLGDFIRYLIQVAWLFLTRWPYKKTLPEAVTSHSDSQKNTHLKKWYEKYQAHQLNFKATASQFVQIEKLEALAKSRFRQFSRLGRRIILIVMSIAALVISLVCISQPFSLQSQFVFVVVLLGIAMVVRRIPGRLPSVILIVVSLIVSCRYIWWRYTATLNWDDPISLICGLLLLLAETYAWLGLVLGYFQSIWPLNRPPVSLPADTTQWPTVDIMIPTYNENLDVVRPAIYAALGVDWPKDKLNIYVLDDGNRDSFKVFAEEVGVHYIRRAVHNHAKAGNINHALKQAKGEYVAIFDCDHIPTRSFLELTMGWFFKDPKLAIVQTPHHFFSPDPFERNLGRFRQAPNEGTLFYGLTQDGNDTWDATFFCGSCAVLSRKALDEVGGIATETVTEDAHTSLRLHRRGYTSAYIRIPLAAGLATESLSAHIGQRIRWARGMTQILRLDSPLFGKGLKFSQRLCYFNAMFNFLSGIPRLIFLVAPLAFLLLHAYIIFAPAIVIVSYVLPHMIHANLTNAKLQGKYRHSFWSEVYDSVLAWYIARPTTVALFNPHKGKFNVTAKGGLVETRHIDWNISLPYLILVLLNMLGLFVGLYRLYYGVSSEIPTVIISLVWVAYNMVILGAAVAVSVETKQVRQTHRVEMAMDGAISTEDGYLYSCTLHDYSNDGVGMILKAPDILKVNDKIHLLLKREQQECSFPAVVTRVMGLSVGVRLAELTLKEHVDFIQCTFAKPDNWTKWQRELPEDRPMQSLADVVLLGFRGYQRMAEYAPPLLKGILVLFTNLVAWCASFLPRTPRVIS